LNEFLNIADIHVLPQRKGIRDLVMPSKLLGMLATGKPIIAMAEKETQVEKDLKNVGIVIEPGDVSKLVSSIKFLYKNKKVCTKLGKLSRTLAYKWDKQTVLSNFFDYLNRM
jgi:colanic acid biosynthesis glycosyl transferase WcaI